MPGRPVCHAAPEKPLETPVPSWYNSRYTGSGRRTTRISIFITPWRTTAYAITAMGNRTISAPFTAWCSLFDGRRTRCWRPSHPSFGGRRTRCWRPSNGDLTGTKAGNILFKGRTLTPVLPWHIVLNPCVQPCEKVHTGGSSTQNNSSAKQKIQPYRGKTASSSGYNREIKKFYYKNNLLSFKMLFMLKTLYIFVQQHQIEPAEKTAKHLIKCLLLH